MVTTCCNNKKCMSIEHTLASINSKCMYCNKGIMKLKEIASYD